MADIKLEDEMKKSYLSYAMSVIVARALPDVRDGLKPVHRRILYAMHELGNTHDKPYKKSARVIGEVLGKYHPHGDAAIYDTLVRMAQPFSLRYTLIDGQGNFGSIDGDPPAAMRYTEARMSRLSEEMLKELGEDTVDFASNFDNTLKEPLVLPARVPQLLINGSSGIAVAMVSNIPPHNLGEVVDALISLVDGASREDVLSRIKGPDFPTGGIITNYEGLRQAYETGRGKIKVMARADVEDNLIKITEIPYQVTKTKIIEDIVNAVKSNAIAGIADVHDRSDKRGLLLEIKVKKGYNPHTILQKLYKHTALRVTYGIISIALVNGKPTVLPLFSMLEEFLKFRREVVRRRTEYRKRKAEAKEHILVALLKALEDVDSTVTIIKSAKDVNAAKETLKKKFDLDDKQAQAILDMKLQKIVALERDALKSDYDKTVKYIEELREILADPKKVDAIIKEELLEVKSKYADERKTEILVDYSPAQIKEDAIVVMTKEGYVKRVHPSLLKSQSRGGVGVRITSHDMNVLSVINATTLDNILVFTNKGKVFSIDVSDIPPGERYSKGMYIGNLVRFDDGEFPIAAYRNRESGEVLFLTKKGIAKRVPAKSFSHVRITGIRAIKFKEDDMLVDVAFASKGENVFVSTKNGKSIMFKQSDLRETSRAAMGVRAIRLVDGDEAVNISAVKEHSIFTITSTGYGRFTDIKDYRLQKRGGGGIINIRLKEGEHVIFSKSVPKQSSLILTSKKGMVIKIRAEDIPSYSRNSRGVKLMKVKDDLVSSVTVVE